MAKSGGHSDVEEKSDRRVNHDWKTRDNMNHNKQPVVTTIRSELWDSEPGQRQHDVRNRAHKVGTAYHHQHPHQHCLTFQVGAAKNKNVIANDQIFISVLKRIVN